MSLKKLVNEIQLHPENCKNTLISYQGGDFYLKSFLKSIAGFSPDVAVQMIQLYEGNVTTDNPSTLKDFMVSNRFNDTLFDLDDGQIWQYVGVSENGNAVCRPHGKNTCFEFCPSTFVKWLF